ncbi:molybdenum cofactor guanylyltransferase [Cellulomonas alba]|uniref:NTP transferase domain-containing protein n=1 Tax=Cellulomonas alba TaxID=3053467 RepID=A0ABT7SFX1_9CELL|nr:NTP transferase domain-containing protein [Cellulomonas alba]MDM7855098.1 NTP transferase domain-containing protein [Cellulomonas alba]
MTPPPDPGRTGASIPYDAVVLAGGRGSRLGGPSKPEVLVAGRALVDHVLDGVRDARRVVLVAPASVARAGVPTVLEDPPGGGPVAGLAAGLAALTDDGLATPTAAVAADVAGLTPARAATAGDLAPDVVVVLACDVPRAGSAVPALVAAAAAGGVDGARLVAADGSVQPLVAAYRRGPLTAALEALASTHGVSMRRALAGLRLVDVPDLDDASLDADTWDDVARLRRAPWWHDQEDGPPPAARSGAGPAGSPAAQPADEPAQAAPTGQAGRPDHADHAAPTDGARR